jgi:hypothetical protein
VDIPFHVIMSTALQLSTHDITQGLRLRLNSVETDVRQIKKKSPSLGAGASLAHNQVCLPLVRLLKNAYLTAIFRNEWPLSHTCSFLQQIVLDTQQMVKPFLTLYWFVGSSRCMSSCRLIRLCRDTFVITQSTSMIQRVLCGLIRITIICIVPFKRVFGQRSRIYAAMSKQ